MEPKELRIPLDVEHMCDAHDAAWVLNYALIAKCEEFTRQLIRNWFSRFTEGSEESLPKEVNVHLRTSHLTGIFQVPGDGTIWLIWENGEVQDLDDLPTWKQLAIMRALEDKYEN